jgi:hypothetical protein
LEEGRGWIFDAKDDTNTSIKDKFPSRFEDLVKQEAVRLGEKFQVAGKWCSFVAVSDNHSKVQKVDKQTETVEYLDEEEFDVVEVDQEPPVKFQYMAPDQQKTISPPVASAMYYSMAYTPPPRISSAGYVIIV